MRFRISGLRSGANCPAGRPKKRSTAGLFSWAAASILLLLILGVPGSTSADASSPGRAPLLRSPDWSVVSGVAEPPPLVARAAILIEAETGTVLFAKNAHLVLPAASLTKVVAIHAAMAASRTGELDLDEDFQPPSEAWAVNQFPGSSLMFLRRNQSLTAWELLEGLAVSSGNDAALALALLTDGSVQRFAARMNSVIGDIGLVSTQFVEPSGLNPYNLTTAYEYAAFALVHIRHFPDLLPQLYSMPGFTYPQPHNMLAADAGPSITQYNRNLLLGSYQGADGIKTGFIDESGYHLAATAERNNRRLIAVVLGVDADSHADGGRLRAADARALLDYGFREFELLRFTPPAADAVRVFKGRTPVANPVGPIVISISVPVGARDRLEGRSEQIPEVVAPIPEGVRIGSAAVTLDGLTLGEAAIALPEVPAGGFFRRFWDGLVMFFSALRGGDKPPHGDELDFAVDYEMPVRALMY